MAIQIDWVEIPAGTFVRGLSREQKVEIMQQLYMGYGIGDLEPYLCQWIENVLDKPLWAYTREERKIREQEALKEYSPVLHYQQAVMALRRIPDEQKRSLPTFYISRFPIVCPQARIFYESELAKRMGWHPPHVLDEPDDRPAMFEYWEQAEACAHWLGGRLPTPLEWEKAARGTDGRLYPWGNEWNPALANVGTPECRQGGEPGKRKGIVTAVDAYPEGASPYGVMDMVGNLGEWLALTEDNQIGYMGVHDQRDAVFQQLVLALPMHRRGATREWLWYVGCRPVLTEWGRRLWPGYRPELEEE